MKERTDRDVPPGVPEKDRRTSEARQAWAETAKEWLFEPVHPAPLGAARILFGLILAIQCWRISEYLAEILPLSTYHVHYPLLRWLDVLPPEGMWLVLATTAGAALLVAAGVLFRPATVVTTAGWTYLFLVDQGHYNNHYYLLSLFGGLLAFTHADEWGSVRHVLGGHRPRPIARWEAALPRAQLVIVYFFGGLAKLDPDWLRARPLEIWFDQRAHWRGVGPLLAHPVTVLLFSWGGLIFDLVIGFALWWKRTRLWAIPPLILFHVANHFLWDIGIFPWFMIGATVLFFERPAPRDHASAAPHEPGGTLGAARPRLVIAGLTLYLAIQLAAPFRHHLYPGHPGWSGIGDLFSWRMMLSDRVGAVKVLVSVPERGQIGGVDLRGYVNFRQFRAMAKAPATFCDFAHFVRDEMKRNAGIDGAELRVVLWRQLNGRPYQKAIDDSVDLANVRCPTFTEPVWITRLVDTPYKLDADTVTREEAERMGF